jgi:hypothetical protein
VRLSGVEVNTTAVTEMRRTFQKLAQIAQIASGSLTDALPRMPSSSSDVVLSVAVLQHIHPSENRAFREILRVARRFICVIEAEWLTLPYLFARDYKRVFEHLGAQEVRSEVISSQSLPGSAIRDYIGYTARLFRVPAHSGDHAATASTMVC